MDSIVYSTTATDRLVWDESSPDILVWSLDVVGFGPPVCFSVVVTSECNWNVDI